MPVHAVPGGFQWGSSGKVYKTRAQAERQARAIYASGWRQDASPAARRALHQALSASRRAEARYVLDLVGIMRRVHEGVMHAVRPEIHRMAEHPLVQDEKVSAQFLQNLFRFVRPRTEEAFGRMSGEVDRANAKTYALLGVRLQAVAGVASQIDHARDRNIKLIENAGRAYADDVREILGDPKNFGRRVEEIADLLEERGRVSASRAQLIARDQTTKLNAAINQHRQLAAGLRQYTWSTSHDERVRDSHRELDGEVFSWLDPPIVDGERANPGEPVQCRCVALPIVEPDEEPEEPKETPPEAEAEKPPAIAPIAKAVVSLAKLGIESELDAAGTVAAEAAIARGGYESYLEAQPLEMIDKTRSKRANGLYSYVWEKGPAARKSRISLNGPKHFEDGFKRAQERERILGVKATLGNDSAFSISSLASSAKDMRERTMVHELGHHLHLNPRDPLAPELDMEIRNGYARRVGPDKKVREGHWTPTVYSRSDHFEWFAETHATYVYEPEVLRKKDPEAFDLMRRVRHARGMQ